MMSKILTFIKLIPKLGVWNISYVAWYRFTLKTGLRKYLYPIDKSLEGPFFRKKELSPGVGKYPERVRSAILHSAEKILAGELEWFSRHTFTHTFTLNSPPDWFFNPFNEKRVEQPDRHWTELTDFDLKVGDIKAIWEQSRFQWTVKLALAYKVSGDALFIETLNEWISDWSDKNPLNSGPNWKCGQETSFRVMNLSLTALLLDQLSEAEPSLLDLLHQHGSRIEPNIQYAIAQDNNHGTSEAVGLYLAGIVLKSNGTYQKEARRWIRKGRKLLEERVDHLVSGSGSFSQHSVNYHRLLLDTISVAELVRRALKVESFSDHFYEKMELAASWLLRLLDPATGSAPNLGANDGALLLQWPGYEYIDYRPAVWLCFCLCRDEAVEFDDFDLPSVLQKMFGQELSGYDETVAPKKSQGAIDQGDGYALLASHNSKVIIRYPRFSFRPSQCDPMHVDFWYQGRNILCDAGSFCYNCPDENTEYFSSIKGHNSVVFDDREPMPKLSRFLYKYWPEVQRKKLVKENDDKSILSWQGEYRTIHGNLHKRIVSLDKRTENWSVEDQLDGAFETAEIYWHLSSNEYSFNDKKLLICGVEISWSSGWQANIIEGWRSQYYMERELIPVLKLSSSAHRTCVTNIKLLQSAQ